jgi:hypothetical protein
MAKGKKTKQPEVSKKNLQKKKAQQIEDQTFGLKNKNKSRVVQKKVQGIEKAVTNGDKRQKAMDEQRARNKQDSKMRKKAMDDERNALFGEALMAIKGKKSGQVSNSGKQEAKGRDADEDDKKPGQSRAMKMYVMLCYAYMLCYLLLLCNYVLLLLADVYKAAWTVRRASK